MDRDTAIKMAQQAIKAKNKRLVDAVLNSGWAWVGRIGCMAAFWVGRCAALAQHRLGQVLAWRSGQSPSFCAGPQRC